MNAGSAPTLNQPRMLVWGYLLSYILLIFILVPYTLELWVFAEKHAPCDLDLLLAATGVGFFLMGAIWFLKGGWPSPFRYCLMLLIIFSGYGIAFLTLTRHPIERVHLFEYSALSFLACRAIATTSVRGLKTYSVSLGVVMLAGTLEEIYQGFYPNRCRDIRDVLLSGLAGALAIAIIALLQVFSPRK